jgi:hypothetical protein
MFEAVRELRPRLPVLILSVHARINSPAAPSRAGCVRLRDDETVPIANCHGRNRN